MVAKVKSPTRTISNRGELPRFIGQFPCAKAQADYLVFDSLTALYCGVYLEWRPDVVSMAFEPREYSFEATASLPELTCIPDYEVILESGEIELHEAKYARDGMRENERENLELAAAHFDNSNIPYKVVYRQDLVADGFIDTILMLRRYGLTRYPTALVESAETSLSHLPAAPLEDWRSRADRAGVPTGLVYHLLYHQRLPLVYRRLLPVELLPCRA